MTWNPTHVDRRRPRAGGNGPSEAAADGLAWQLPRGDRRLSARRVEDLERRLTDAENLTRANRRELDLQFQRMAQMQADIDALLKAARSSAPTSRMPQLETHRIAPDRRDEPSAVPPPVSRRRRP